jgi:hypothetical protein
LQVDLPQLGLLVAVEEEAIAGQPAISEAIGGIVASAGVGTFLQIAIGGDPSAVGLAVSATLAVTGITMLSAALAR